jgi:hypothetical protein
LIALIIFANQFSSKNIFWPQKVLFLPLSKNLDFPAASGRRSLPPFDEKGTLEQMETRPKISLQCFLILYFFALQ